MASYRLRQGDSGSSELTYIKAERYELKEMFLELERERDKRSLEEGYDLLVGEKVSLEDQVATLDGSVEHFS